MIDRGADRYRKQDRHPFSTAYLSHWTPGETRIGRAPPKISRLSRLVPPWPPPLLRHQRRNVISGRVSEDPDLGDPPSLVSLLPQHRRRRTRARVIVAIDIIIRGAPSLSHVAFCEFSLSRRNGAQLK